MEAWIIPVNTPVSAHISMQPFVDTFIRKMNGGSQSCLVGASDNRFYVVKLADNPQGPNVLFNEAFGALLAGYLKLPVPEWRPLNLTEGFISQNPGFWFDECGKTRPPKPGLHFGSLVVTGSEQREVYEVLPCRWLERIRKPELLVGILLLDIWAENVDRRQMLLIERPHTKSLDLLFFDHGHLFRGPHGQKALKNPEACLYYYQTAYKRAFEVGNYDNWLRLIEELDLDKLNGIVEFVPVEWRRETHVRNVIDLLMRNRETLRGKITTIAKKFC